MPVSVPRPQPRPAPTTLIVASGPMEYERFVRHNQVDPRSCRLIMRPDDLRGYRHVQIVFIGDWFMQPWAEEVVRIARYIR